MNANRIPTEQECHELMRRYDMLPNIFDHSVQVMNVAVALIDHLKDPGIICRELVVAGALLHDIAKTSSIRTGDRRHDLAGGKLLREIGLEMIAPIVETHVAFGEFHPDGPLEERELIYYADKRVMHDRVVSISERIDDLVNRYGINERICVIIRDNKNFVLDLERKIGAFLTRDIDDILSKLR